MDIEITEEEWPIYRVGESVCFRGWWWKVVATVDPSTNPAFIALKPERVVTEDDIPLLEIELRTIKMALRSKGVTYHERHRDAVDELFEMRHRVLTGCRQPYGISTGGGVDTAYVACDCGARFEFGGGEIAWMMDNLVKNLSHGPWPWWQTVARMARLRLQSAGR